VSGITKEVLNMPAEESGQMTDDVYMAMVGRKVMAGLLTMQAEPAGEPIAMLDPAAAAAAASSAAGSSAEHAAM